MLASLGSAPEPEDSAEFHVHNEKDNTEAKDNLENRDKTNAKDNKEEEEGDVPETRSSAVSGGADLACAGTCNRITFTGRFLHCLSQYF